MGLCFRTIASFFAVAIILTAQTSTSSITGTVTDTSGTVVPGAAVTLANDETGVTATQKTNQSGVYAFASIPINLEIGETSDVVTVAATAEALQTTDAGIGNVVSQKEISELPLDGRNPLGLLVLEPGVVQMSKGADGTGIEANESAVSNPMNNVFRLNPDSTREYRITTSNATAEYGRNSGANVSIATRGGTNKFHGTMFEFLRNTALNSNEFFANAQGAEKPEIKLNQFGAEFGGPIKHNKTFFFANWQRQRAMFSQAVDQAYGSVPTVYTPSALSGVYRYFLADPAIPFKLDGVTITRNTPLLVDPKTGALSSGVRNCASPAGLNCVATFNFFNSGPNKTGPGPAILKLFKSMPAPNSFVAGDGLNTWAFAWNPPAHKNGDSVTGRIDHNVSDKHVLFARYIWSTNDTLGGDPNNSRPVLYPGFPALGEVYRASLNGALRWTWIVTPRIVNEFTAGISRFSALFTQGEANPDFPNTPAFSRAAGTGFNNLDAPFRNVPRTFHVVTTPQIIDNLSITRGAHLIKVGVNMRFYRHNDQRGQPGGATVTPTLDFSTGIRSPVTTCGQPAQSATGRAGIDSTGYARLQGTINDIMGIPSQLSQTFLDDLVHNNYLPFKAGDGVTLWNQGHRLKQYNIFVQDEWKLRSNLTINAGLRWEINPPSKEAAGGAFVPNKPIDGSEGPVTFVKAGSWFNRNNLGAIGPRLSVAWSPMRKTVFRTGYAMAFDTLSSFQVTAVGCGAVPNVRYSQGFPTELPLPTSKPSDFLTPPAQIYNNALGMTTFDPNLKVPTVHQWNFSIQRELPFDLVAQSAYVGRRGTRLYRSYDSNQINADSILPDFSAMQRNYNKGCRPDGTTCPAGSLKLRPNRQFGVSNYIDSGGDSYYHALQSTVRRRFRNGVLVGIAYTLQKCIDDQSVDPIGSSSGGGLSTTNTRTPASTKNWRNAVELADVPGIVGQVYFSELTSAFTARAPGSDGMGRNTFTGPSFWNQDGGLTKSFRGTERINVQFRAEFFNVLNHPNFDEPPCYPIGVETPVLDDEKEIEELSQL